MAGSGTAGGSLALVELIDRFGEHIEADLARYYGVDLRAAFRRPAPPRQPMRAALGRPLAPHTLGTLAGVLVGLVIVVPALAFALSLVLSVAAAYAWHVEQPGPSAACALTPRRVIALVRALPHDSATVAAARGGDTFRGWDANRYLLALIADLLQDLIYVQVSKGSKRKPQRPTPIPRPDDGQPSQSGGGEHGLRGQLQNMLRRKANRKAVT